VTEIQTKTKSDLGVRTASAVVMMAIAGTALWFGGWVWTIFAAVIGAGVFWEWSRLVLTFQHSAISRTLWLTGGLIYIGAAASLLALVRVYPDNIYPPLVIVLSVIVTDVGAYGFGRTFGGPKIAPSISPSKTWSGLAGGMLAAATLGVIVTYFQYRHNLAEYAEYVQQYGNPDDWHSLGWQWGYGLAAGCLVAVVAQAGDFFQSWMKRRAGVKDSSNLIPGHGGLFDRVDGLIAVLFAMAILQAVRSSGF
jgi:phosphatidate cytidylyltransferase